MGRPLTDGRTSRTRERPHLGGFWNCIPRSGDVMARWLQYTLSILPTSYYLLTYMYAEDGGQMSKHVRQIPLAITPKMTLHDALRTWKEERTRNPRGGRTGRKNERTWHDPYFFSHEIFCPLRAWLAE